MNKIKILVTGAAGFIGYHAAKALTTSGFQVIGLDNTNAYYDVNLKYARLSDAGISEKEIIPGELICSTKNSLYRFIQLDITNRNALAALFEKEKFTHVLHLAAQAGVRYSLENPYTYIDSNVVGFENLLENCRNSGILHFVYASSSSVYGLNTSIPYRETDMTERPASLYAATKKANELMAHVYSHLFSVPTTGIRFFTVYGPWGRPDMAPHLFMNAVLNEKPISVFNHGNMQRDFTFIDDIVKGILKIIPSPPDKNIPYEIYNMGNSQPVALMDFIGTIEKTTGKKAILNFEKMQPGDVRVTYADTSHLEHDFNYKPTTSIETGIQKFHEWFVGYYKQTNKELNK